jgi:two-component system sensor histidine kinase KdpD
LASDRRAESHDLRGLLSGIAGLSELLQEDLRRGETANLRPWLAMVETQIRRLATLVEDLLNLTRVSKGQLVRRSLPLQAVLHEALQALALGKAGQRIDEVSVGELPELNMDGGLMRQVFVNLQSCI